MFGETKITNSPRGVLPRKASEQKVFFEEMNKAHATSIFYEAPHRLVKTLKTQAKCH